MEVKPGYKQTALAKVVTDFSRRGVDCRGGVTILVAGVSAKRARLAVSTVLPTKVVDYFRRRVDEHLKKMGAVWK